MTWTSITAEAPPANENVLICREGEANSARVAWFNDSPGKRPGGWIDDDGDPLEWSDLLPTHWQRIEPVPGSVDAQRKEQS